MGAWVGEEVGEGGAGEVEYVVGYVACDADRNKDLHALVDAEVMRSVLYPEHMVVISCGGR